MALRAGMVAVSGEHGSQPARCPGREKGVWISVPTDGQCALLGDDGVHRSGQGVAGRDIVAAVLAADLTVEEDVLVPRGDHGCGRRCESVDATENLVQHPW